MTISEGSDTAAARFRDFAAGRRPQHADMEEFSTPDAARATGRQSAGFVADAGAEDEEHPTRGIIKAPIVQTRLSIIVDSCVLSGVTQALTDAGAHADIRRLDELGHASTEHAWMWALSPNWARTLKDVEFVEAVRIRLGAGGPWSLYNVQRAVGAFLIQLGPMHLAVHLERRLVVMTPYAT